MQPLVWLPAVVLPFCLPAGQWERDAATSCHVRIPMLWLVSVHYTTSSVYPQQAIHMLMLATASLITLDFCDLVQIQSVIELFVKQQNNALDVP